MPKKLYNEPSPLETSVVSKRFGLAEFRIARYVSGQRRLQGVSKRRKR